MKFFIMSLTIILTSLLISSCSGSAESTTETAAEEQDIYIFDDIKEADSSSVAEMLPIPVDTVESVISRPNEYIVQVGAFTTDGRAQEFVMLNQSKIEWKMKISYSTKVQLWVVQLPAFGARAKAEEVRNKLWETQTFQDAFIVPEK